jgi:thymidylate synthase ThyX
MSKKTTVKLISWTQHPLETIYCEWLQSRTTDPVPTAGELAAQVENERMEGAEQRLVAGISSENRWTQHPLEMKILDTFEKVVAMKMPLGETLDFIFLLENCPIALREQLVRHRIGHSFGDKIGADIIPDLAGKSSFWSQTTRIISMENFASNGDYHTPVWLDEHGDEGESVDAPNLSAYYEQCMRDIQMMYRNLVRAGMPLEDARNVLPVAMQHRMTWKANLSSLFHVLSRRSCWLAQLGFWEPVIEGIIEELATKVHPIFRRLADPPCIDPKTGNYGACVFGKENEEVISNGNYPPCTLWVNKENSFIPRQPKDAAYTSSEINLVSPQQLERYNRMQERYAKLWMRDPRTGERKQIA